MKFETLYTLDSKNKIRVFECEATNTLVITRTGLLGGKLIEKVENIRTGKQRRTPEEQANFVANSLYNEKLHEGYKSYNDLIECCLKDNIDLPQNNDGKIKVAFQLYPQASYTNKNWDELPMLAHKYKDIKKPEFPYYAQPKLNGVRCLAKFKQGKILLCSRGGQYYQITHLQNQLFSLFNHIEKSGIKDTFLFDGEIYVHGIPLQDISGAARKEELVADLDLFTPPTNSWLEYHIYDVINLNKPNETQKQRYENLLGLALHLHTLQDINSIKIVETKLVNNANEAQTLHDKYVADGYEGLILRGLEGTYEFNQRSKNLLKVKQYQDEEFEIVNCVVDENIGESFVFVLKNNINDLTFEARPTGNILNKLNWYSNIQKYIGKKATVRYFERSKDGLPLQGSVQHKISPILIEHIRPYGE